MPRIRREVQHKIWRDDAITYAKVADVALGAVEPAAYALLWAWVAWRGLPRIWNASYSHGLKVRPPGAPTANSELEARTIQLPGKLAACMSPYLVLLGSLYQGIITGLGVGALTTVAAAVMANVLLNAEKDADGYVYAWSLHPVDRAAIAAMLPLVLWTMRQEGHEKNPGILGSGVGL